MHFIAIFTVGTIYSTQLSVLIKKENQLLRSSSLCSLPPSPKVIVPVVLFASVQKTAREAVASVPVRVVRGPRADVGTSASVTKTVARGVVMPSHSEDTRTVTDPYMYQYLYNQVLKSLYIAGCYNIVYLASHHGVYAEVRLYKLANIRF